MHESGLHFNIAHIKHRLLNDFSPFRSSIKSDNRCHTHTHTHIYNYFRVVSIEIGRMKYTTRYQSSTTSDWIGFVSFYSVDDKKQIRDLIFNCPTMHVQCSCTCNKMKKELPVTIDWRKRNVWSVEFIQCNGWHGISITIIFCLSLSFTKHCYIVDIAFGCRG